MTIDANTRHDIGLEQIVLYIGQNNKTTSN